jgi:hypothetical protein
MTLNRAMICRSCGLRQATEVEWDTCPPGEGAQYCWDRFSGRCEPVDWFDVCTYVIGEFKKINSLEDSIEDLLIQAVQLMKEEAEQ